jgi:two-component system KDP operon response regulator KdpE
LKVLIIEDDLATAETVSLALQLRWPDVQVTSTAEGSEGTDLVDKESPDVAILDLGLPDVDGMAVLKEIRQFSDVPIIILTARTQQGAIVKGLELGADDYITKPFDPIVLVARVSSVLRRSHMPCLKESDGPLVSGELLVDFASAQATHRGKPIKLTATEWKLLHCLFRNKGRIVPYQVLWEKAWGTEYFDDIPAIRTCIWRLRAKLGDNAMCPSLIVGERGLGYRLVVSKQSFSSG